MSDFVALPYSQLSLDEPHAGAGGLQPKGADRDLGRGVSGDLGVESAELIHSTDELDGEVDVVIYPWDITVTTGDGPTGSEPNVIGGVVGSLMHIGGRVRVAIAPLSAELTRPAAGQLTLSVGAAVQASFRPDVTRLVSRR